jgi:aminoglycoside phosphotransferase (APT) family kinase protein
MITCSTAPACSPAPAETRGDARVSETYNLLRQVRTAVGAVLRESDRREHQALLSCADVVLNELMLRTHPAFYLAHVAEGQALLAEGKALAPDAAPIDEAQPLGDVPSMDAVSARLDHLASAMANLLGYIDESATEGARRFARRVSDWEAALYRHSLADAGATAPAEASPFTREALESYLRARRPDWPNLRIVHFEPLTGGFSKRTVLFACEDDVSGRQSLILRAEQAVSLPRFSDVTQEFHLIRFAVDAGLPTPDALWLESDLSHFGTPFLIMEVAQGENYGWTMGRQIPPSQALVQSIIDALCAMHKVRTPAGHAGIAASHLAEWTPFGTIRDNARHYVTEYMPRLIRESGIVPSPELTRALRWLAANVPEVEDPPVLVHLDFGLNNILIEGERVSAILDWESARLGDPCDDIMVMQRELAEYLTEDEFLTRYRAGTGRTITPYNMAYAKVAAFAMYMIVYLNGRQKLLRDERTPIAMGLLAFRYIANTAAQLNDLIADAERLRSEERTAGAGL